MDKLHTRTPRGDLTNDLLEINQGTSESVHRRDNQLITVAQVPDALFELLAIWTVPVLVDTRR